MKGNLTIVVPTRPQPDTLVAIFLLKTFGKERFPGIETALVEVNPSLPSEPFETHLEKGILPIDIGGGPFDHHSSGDCASELVARLLAVSDDPSIAKLLAYAKRDDAFGKGTVSVDPLDRAFGLSGLIASLNKQYPKNPQRIIDIVLPLLEAQYLASREHHVELPREVEEKKRKGHYTETNVRQGNKKFKVAFVVSDKPAMPTYLRAYQGARADVVVQRSEEGNRVCILTKQDRGVNLSLVAALIRLREAELRNITLPDDRAYIMQDGKINELPMWYVDPATKSILNVGNGPQDDSAIPWEEMKKIVPQGLEIAPEKR
jgi:hypothetical protein